MDLLIRLIRPIVLGAAFVGLLSCTPEILSETYFCGPNALCPPDLTCDGDSFTCTRPIDALEFQCKGPSIEDSSNPTMTTDLGDLACGRVVGAEDFFGCVDAQDDIDLYTFNYDVDCGPRPSSMSFVLVHPIAFMPLTMTVTDELGQEIAESVSCTPNLNETGQRSECVDLDAPAKGRYRIRVESADDGQNCSGDCPANFYTIVVRHGLSS